MAGLKKEHYVYAYLDPRKPGKYVYNPYCLEYEPFYIGVGKDRRIKDHMKQAERMLRGKSYRNPHKIRKINKIISLSLYPVIITLKEKLSRNSALKEEMRVISLIGRIDLKTGPLTNKTGGGDGCRDQSPESRLRYGQKMKEKYRQGELVAWSKGQTGIYSEETRKNISDNLKKYYKTHDIWNKGTKGKQKAWNKGLSLKDSRVQKYTKTREEKRIFKKYQFIKDGKIVTVTNLQKFCKQKDLLYSELIVIGCKGFRNVSWTNPKTGKKYKYKYYEYKGYKKFEGSLK